MEHCVITDHWGFRQWSICTYYDRCVSRFGNTSKYDICYYDDHADKNLASLVTRHAVHNFKCSSQCFDMWILYSDSSKGECKSRRYCYRNY